MNNTDNIKSKIKQILGKDRIKPKDFELLDKFVENFDKDDDVDEWLKQNWIKAGNAVKADNNNHSTQKKHTPVKNKNVFAWGKIAVAAGTVAIAAMLWWLHILTGSNPPDKIAGNTINMHPQSNTPGVVLESAGERIDLSKGEINRTVDNLNIVGGGNNIKLTCATSKKYKEKENAKQNWSTLKVSIGKDYYVVLPDGTQVWMNACSELKFPDYFMDGKREVELKGEAFFIVKSDTENPFYVKTAFSQVCVTGTQFNVYSYPHEKTSMVTLLEGKVDVNIDGNSHRVKPGEQLVQDKNNGFAIKKVDPYQYISWKDGVFEFKKMPLSDMALRLEKWYNVKFTFNKPTIANECFTGMVKKEQSIEYFIQILEKTTKLKFTLNGSEIVVKQS